MTLTLNPAIQTLLKHIVSVWLKFLSGFFEILQGLQELQIGREKSNMAFDPLSMTLTLNPAIRNIASARRLSLVNICVRFLRNPSRASRVTERKGKKVIWFLTPKYDLDLESSHPEHCLWTLSQSGKHLCQVSLKSFKGFKSYRSEGKKVIWLLTR